MLSFRSILFAASALDTIISAIPTPDRNSGFTNILSVGGVRGGLPSFPHVPAKRQGDGFQDGGDDSDNSDYGHGLGYHRRDSVKRRDSKRGHPILR